MLAIFSRELHTESLIAAPLCGIFSLVLLLVYNLSTRPLNATKWILNTYSQANGWGIHLVHFRRSTGNLSVDGVFTFSELFSFCKFYSMFIMSCYAYSFTPIKRCPYQLTWTQKMPVYYDETHFSPFHDILFSWLCSILLPINFS